LFLKKLFISGGGGKENWVLFSIIITSSILAVAVYAAGRGGGIERGGDRVAIVCPSSVTTRRKREEDGVFIVISIAAVVLRWKRRKKEITERGETGVVYDVPCVLVEDTGKRKRLQKEERSGFCRGGCASARLPNVGRGAAKVKKRGGRKEVLHVFLRTFILS